MKKKGFTLIELLVVISIIAILAAMVVGGITYAKQKALVAKTKGAMNTIKIGLETYNSDEGYFPGGADDPTEACEDNIGYVSEALMGSPSGPGGRSAPYLDFKRKELGYTDGDAPDYFKVAYKNPTEAQMDSLYEDDDPAGLFYLLDAWGHPFHYIEVDSRDGDTRRAGVSGTLKGVETWIPKNRNGFDLFSAGPQEEYTGNDWNPEQFIGNW